MFRKISVVSIAFFAQSCIVHIANGNEFNSLSANDQNRVEKLEAFNNVEHGKVYEITGKQLKTELKRHDKSLVYTFSNGCSSDNCLPLSTIEKYAAINGYSLFLVTNSYFRLNLTFQQEFSSPIFAVNSEFYGQEKSRIYMKSFKQDIGYFEHSSGKYVGSYIFYQQDSLVNIKTALE